MADFDEDVCEREILRVRTCPFLDSLVLLHKILPQMFQFGVAASCERALVAASLVSSCSFVTNADEVAGNGVVPSTRWIDSLISADNGL